MVEVMSQVILIENHVSRFHTTETGSANHVSKRATIYHWIKRHRFTKLQYPAHLFISSALLALATMSCKMQHPSPSSPGSYPAPQARLQSPDLDSVQQ